MPISNRLESQVKSYRGAKRAGRGFARERGRFAHYLGMVGFVVVAAACATLGLFAASAGAAVRFGVNEGLPTCAEAGCLYGSVGVAVDPVNGDVYVAETENRRVSVFAPSGEFLFAFGYGVRDGADALETCTAATNCLVGLSGSGAGEFSSPQTVTVDAEGNVYVAEPYGVEVNHQLEVKYRVEKFKAEEVSGHEPVVKFVAAFEAGFIGQLTGDAGNVIAVGGPHDDVYVGDKGRVDVFERSGAFVEHVVFTGVLAEGPVEALAVDPAGDLFVQVGERAGEGGPGVGAVPGVRELEANGTEKAVFDPGGFAGALALNATGDLYIADAGGGLKILAYHTATDSLFQSFEPSVGAETTKQGAFGMAFSSGVTPEPELYMTGFDGEWVGWVEGVPPAGPWVKAGSESGSPEPRGSATLRASVDPEGDATACRFEYDTREYGPAEAAHGTSVPCEPSSSLGEGFATVGVVAHLKGLTPSATYHWRVVASSSAGTAECTGARGCSPDQSFQETASALIEAWSSKVSASDAVVNARVDPLGVETTYRLEWGRTTAYEEPAVSGDVGSGEAYVPISVPLTGLRPHTLYYYRLVSSSTVGSSESDATFTTQLAVPGVLLADERAWEQVSPVEKQNGELDFADAQDLVQAAADGDRVAYVVNGPITGAPDTSDTSLPVLSTRGEDGWRSLEPGPGKSLPEPPTEAQSLFSDEFLPFWSADLSHAVVEPLPYVKGLSPEAHERTLYVWDAESATFTPVVTSADDETGVPYGGRAPSVWMEFRGATPDLSHVLFSSKLALTGNAITGPELPKCEMGEPCVDQNNLYEWWGGRLHLVNVPPSGQPPLVGATLGRSGEGQTVAPYSIHAVSSDGRWVVWSSEVHETNGGTTLYVRDMVGERTFQLGGRRATFETMSSDGSRVFYLEDGDLYEFDTTADTTSEITPHGAGEASAGVKDAILGASEDGSAVYFVATGDLTGSQDNGQGASAQAGAPNLYLLRDTGSGWEPTFIATLGPEDEHDWFAKYGLAGTDSFLDLTKVTSHVSPDGRWVAFMSDLPLTGYDNHDAVSGVADEEVFLYDAQANKLVCASCNPTGARPQGMFDKGWFYHEPGSSAHQARTHIDPASAWEGRWIAGFMPGWRPFRANDAMYDPRVVLDSGRLFFQSPDALVPQDTNGTEDVYEYEPVGVGSCEEASATFSPASGGCVNLISGGKSPQESVFYDASESGDDVFFSTQEKLAWSDVDEAGDVYDARAPHVPGEPVGFPEPEKPPACEGDACQGTPAPLIDQTPASLAFTGPGNLTAPPPALPVKAKPLTRAELLARALKACHAKHNRRKRLACEKQAHERYPSKSSKGRQ
jgi:hypothetical protein